MTETFNDDIMHPSLCNYKNDIDFVDKLISIYSIVHLKKADKLRKFEKDILNYYMRFGYSTQTKKRIAKELRKSAESVTQTTFHLKNKGLLINSKTNFSTKKLNEELQEIKDFFIDGDKKVLAIGFLRKI